MGNMKNALENLKFYKESLLNDTNEEKKKLFNCVNKLLKLLNEKNNENEIWELLNIHVNCVKIDIKKISYNKSNYYVIERPKIGD